ncbi:endonuclease domain-containing protein [Luedemannella flava]|uniref:endonuclease domain-containing protein n=1 Tax=Luedemannella flava TaxID=349316 RepID=UPI0031D044E5
MDLPADDADDLTWLLFRQHHVLTRRQALQHLTEDAVRHRLRTGRWVQRAPPGVRIHRTRHLHPDDLRPAGAPPSTMPARSLVNAVQWAVSADQARFIMAATFQQRPVDATDIDAVLARLPKVRRQGLLRRTLADVGAGSHTLAELDLLRLCGSAGLPTPSRQVRRTDADGRDRYLDLYFDEWGVHVEVDGAHHMDVRQWWRDMHRQNALSAHGLRTLRFPSFAVREQPDVVVAQLRTALVAAGWRG